MKLQKIVVIAFALWMVGCGASKNGTNSTAVNSSNSESVAVPEDTTPAIEISAEALTKEWVENPSATNSKYTGKKLLIKGNIEKVSMYENNSGYVTLRGALMNDPGNRRMNVTCNTTVSDYLRFIKPVSDKSNEMGSAQKPTGTFKGVYSKTYTENPEPSIEFEPCEIIAPKSQ